MNETTSLTMDTLLTPQQAADVTNRSVQNFYTEKRKADFGFADAKGGKWLIPVSLLVKHRFLTPDFQPTKGSPRVSRANEPSAVFSDVERQAMVITQLENERDTLHLLVQSLRRQIEILEELLQSRSASN